MKAAWSAVAGVVAMGAMSAGALAASTWTVGPGDDVQFEIDKVQVVDGDTIKFLPGTYNQSIYLNKRLKLTGVTGSGPVILDGSGLGGPIIQTGVSVSGVEIQNLTFRFTDTEYGDYSYPAIDAYDSCTDGLRVLRSTFRALDGGGIDACGEALAVANNVFRGCAWSYYLEGEDIWAKTNKHRQNLEGGGTVESYGDTLIDGDRVAGCNGLGVEIEGDFFFDAVGTGTDIVDGINVRRSVDGVSVASSAGSSVVNCRMFNVSGRGVGFVGTDFVADANTFYRTAIGVQVEGDYLTVHENRIFHGNIGILVYGEAEVTSNQINDVTVGIRVQRHPYFSEEEFPSNGGGYTSVADNKIKKSIGPAIVLHDVGAGPYVSENDIDTAGGRTYVDLVFNFGDSFDEFGAVEPSAYERRYGAVTVNRTVFADVYDNDLGDVDAGHGIAMYGSSGSSIRNNRIGAFHEGDPATKPEHREEDGVALNGIEVTHWLPYSDGPFGEFGPDSYFYYFMSQTPYLPFFPARGVNPGYYGYNYDYGTNNSVSSNTISAAATVGGAGISVRNQYSIDVESNVVCYSGGTGILLASVDSAWVYNNHVKDSERDGISLVSSLSDGGNYFGPEARERFAGVLPTIYGYSNTNYIDGNLVEYSGAEGIQNTATADFDYWSVPVGSYCESFAAVPECEYQPYAYYYGATVIRNNTVRFSGISNFANEGDVIESMSNNNTSIDGSGTQVDGWDWYDLPIRQY